MDALNNETFVKVELSLVNTTSQTSSTELKQPVDETTYAQTTRKSSNNNPDEAGKLQQQDGIVLLHEYSRQNIALLTQLAGNSIWMMSIVIVINFAYTRSS